MFSIINQTEMIKLIFGLRDRGIEFKARSLFNGLKIIAEDWSAICCDSSNGHEQGLIEVMGLPEDKEDVIGWLTAEEILRMVDQKIEK